MNKLLINCDSKNVCNGSIRVDFCSKKMYNLGNESFKKAGTKLTVKSLLSVGAASAAGKLSWILKEERVFQKVGIKPTVKSLLSVECGELCNKETI